MVDSKKMGANAVTHSQIPEGDFAQAQCGRILSSELFRNSPMQQRLFLYLVEQGLSGTASSLKEYTVGVNVFHRGEDFDPRADSIVRVQAGVLRKKLRAYYAGPGAGDSLVIEIPRGTYAPHFTTREPGSISHAATAADLPLRQPAWWIAISAVLLVAVAMIFYHLGAARERPIPAAKISPTSPGSFEWRDHPLWQGFFVPGSTTRLVIGVPFTVAVWPVIVRDTQVNSSAEIARSSTIQQLERMSGATAVPTELYTGLGEAAGISLLTRFFDGASQNLPLIRNRLTRWQDLTAGNVILLASLRFRTVKQELNLPTDFEFVGAPGRETAVRNLKPRAGEAKVYECSMQGGPKGEQGSDFALVSLWPGTWPNRRIMAIGGTHTWGTEGAVEYVTDGPSLRELRKRLGTVPPNDKGLQVLLRVETKENQIVTTRYVTHHWLQ